MCSLHYAYSVKRDCALLGREHASSTLVPGPKFREGRTQIAWDSEILQSFTELTNITSITFHAYNESVDSLENVTYQIQVGGWMCDTYHHEQCVPRHNYIPWYIWTKEGFKI